MALPVLLCPFVYDLASIGRKARVPFDSGSSGERHNFQRRLGTPGIRSGRPPRFVAAIGSQGHGSAGRQHRCPLPQSGAIIARASILAAPAIAYHQTRSRRAALRCGRTATAGLVSFSRSSSASLTSSIALGAGRRCTPGAKTDASGDSESYNKKKFGLRLELWKPIPAVLYEGRSTNRR